MSNKFEGFLTPIVSEKNKEVVHYFPAKSNAIDKRHREDAQGALEKLMKIKSLAKNEEGLDALCALVHKTKDPGATGNVKLNIDGGFVSDPLFVDPNIYYDTYVARISASKGRKVRFEDGFTITIFYGDIDEVDSDVENDYLKSFMAACCY